MAPIDPAAVGRLVRTAAENLVTALEDALNGGPDLPLSGIDALDESELHRVLHEWNATAAGVPDATLPELFEAQAARTPDAIAVASGGQELTYAELNRRADGLAGELRDRGVGPESVVAVVMERDAELVVALLAVLKAGGAYLPLDPEYPAERIGYMLRDAAPAVVLASPGVAALLPPSPAPAIVLDGTPGRPLLRPLPQAPARPTTRRT
ncbi:AMP-binding protein [Nonomuraea thailandensis]